jgi:hypothetical protein
VYPPVDTDFFHPDGRRRAIRARRVGPRALQAHRRGHRRLPLAGVPLKIVGDGPERARSSAAADGDVEFLGRRLGRGRSRAVPRAAVTLLPGEEDFGIVPLEAQACGARSSRSAAAARSKRSCRRDRTLVDDRRRRRSPTASRRRSTRVRPRRIRRTPSASAAALRRRDGALIAEPAMVNRHNRLLVAFTSCPTRCSA